MNMIDPVSIPAAHLKKIVPKDQTNSDNEDFTEDANGKRKWNTITSTSTNMNTNTDTNYMKELSDDVKTMDTNIKPDTSMTATSNITSDEQQTVIVAEENEEGIDPDVIFTSDEEDNIFNDVVEENTMAYCDTDNELQIVGETRSTFNFNPLTRSFREEVGPLIEITKFTNIPYTHIGQELKGLPRFREK